MATVLVRPIAATATARRIGQVRAAHGLVLLVLLAFAGAALVVPTLAPVAVTDDWIYERSVERLLVDHHLEVHQMSSAALLFQTLWGTLFAAVFGLSYGTLRISTLVMTALGGLAVYGLARELGVPRGWSALGLAAYLFHPLVISLSYTFMTDPHYVALLVIATWLYVRGLRVSRSGPAWGWLVAGSVVAAWSSLVRQQGLLVPAGVMAGLLLGGRLLPVRRGLGLLVATGAVPVVVAVVYNTWLREANGTPWALSLFWLDIAHAGWRGVAGLLPRLGVIEALYVGGFVLPVAIGALASVPALGRGLHPLAACAALAWTALVGVGALVFWLTGRQTMPYVGQFVTATGIGPEDLLAARPVLLDEPVRIGLTVVCGLASILGGWAVARRLGAAPSVVDAAAAQPADGAMPAPAVRRTAAAARDGVGAMPPHNGVAATQQDAGAAETVPHGGALAAGTWSASTAPRDRAAVVATPHDESSAATGRDGGARAAGRDGAAGAGAGGRFAFGSGVGIVVGVAAGQWVGVVPPSVHFIGWGGTLDRYLLPLLPFSLLLLLWALRGQRVVLPLAWLVVVVLGGWSVAGTRDHLAWLEGVWSLADEATGLGIAATHLDAGAGWDGAHLYVAPPSPSLLPRTEDGPWWTELFAPRTDSSYVVAGDRLPGYSVVLERGYWSWLQRRWLPLYLLRRPDVPGPP